MEDKQKITEKLFELVQLTRAGSNIVSMKYREVQYGEIVEIRYAGGMGGTKIDVTADSGMAMIRDVLRGV